MTSINKSKLCCDGFREAIEDGSGNEGWGAAIGVGWGEGMREKVWELGSCMTHIHFCPFCGKKLLSPEKLEEA